MAWEGKTKLGFPSGSLRLIFTDNVRAQEWLSDFVEGHAWLEPLYSTPPQHTWVGLTWNDVPDEWVGKVAFMEGAKWADKQLKEKNT